jgi:hypothetical protein
MHPTVRAARLLRDPHAALGVGAALVVASEYGRESLRPVPWALVEVIVGVGVLALLWRGRDRLRLGPILLVALAFHVGWIVVRVHQTLGPDFEWRDVYAQQGQAVLDGHYPSSEYPTGAVSLFALEALLGGARTHLVHSLLLVPFQLAVVVALWSLRTRWSAWFAAVVAFWPLNAWFWEYRFDLVPAALLVAGLAFAHRSRWALAGSSLALGAAVKWSPAVAVPVLAAYLLVSRRPRDALRLTAGFALTLAVVTLPYLLWSPAHVLAAYSKQGGRSITDESLWHLPLHLLGLESRHGYDYPAFFSVGPPGWADAVAVAVQVAALAALIAAGARARTQSGAIALAALAPVAFLVANRVFSVQYFVVLLAAWAVAGALLIRSERQALAATSVALGATVASALIVPYPIHRPHVWEFMSGLRFALAISLTAWLAVQAVRLGREETPPSEDAGA